MNRLLLTFSILLCTTSFASAGHRSTNLPYVQSLTERGVFYARCIPAQQEGTQGTTTIYRVGTETDERLDVYNWYSPEGVVLAHSPLTGQIAVLSLRQGNTSTDAGIELSFHLSGKLLRSYTAKQLEDLGVRPALTSAGRHLDYQVKGVEQRPPGTNNYVFVIEFNRGSTPPTENHHLYFDILTGDQRK